MVAHLVLCKNAISGSNREQVNTVQIINNDRGHANFRLLNGRTLVDWGIETGLHLRLDVIAGEDRSRVRHPTSALNLAMIRRAVVSVAVAWIKKCPNKRKATMSGFYDFMAAKQAKKAFSLVTACHPSWLPKS